MRIARFFVRLVVVFTALVTGLSLASTAAALAYRDRLRDDTQPEDDEINLSVVLAGRDFRSTSTAFRGGRVLCWQGGGNLDLRGAQLDPGGASLDVLTVFGGMGVRVPEHWRVRVHGIGIFGGAGSTAARPDDDDPGPVLDVRYRALFGGFGVVAEPDDEVLAV